MIGDRIDRGCHGPGGNNDWDWEPEEDSQWEDIPDWGVEPGWSDVDADDLEGADANDSDN